MSLTEPLGAELPWLQSTQQQLAAALDEDRLSHALLLQVAPGLGGEWLAYWLAARIFCQGANKPCGACLACRRVSIDEQPDFSVLRPIEDSKEIRVDQIRELVGELSLTSHGGRRKVVIISPAEKLNRAAANALLKTLEEPSAGTLIMLVTGEPSRLPATVLSRCARVTFKTPARSQLVDWLRRHKGATTDWQSVLEVIGDRPLDALAIDALAVVALAEETRRALEAASRGHCDAITTAEIWGKESYAWRIACMEQWVLDTLRARVAEGDTGDGRMLIELLDELREARQWADSPINKTLVLERLLWRVSALSATATNRRRA
jgi:DNA polymerase-3 subunit delta'